MTSLPKFPWDRLAPFVERARAHPEGVVDLSVGTPADPTPDIIRRALSQSADAPGYPKAAGSTALRDAITAWVRRECGAEGAFDVLPTIGSKEIVAGLAAQRGIGGDDAIGVPQLSYPTYEVGARLAGARLVRMGPDLPESDGLRLLWLNYPANPTGEVVSAERMREIVDWCRARDVIVASDECYLTLKGSRQQVSVLHPEVCGGDATGLLALHSLSKRSNMAGYRAGFLAGDPQLVDRLLQLRRHSGMIPPAPVQAAMIAALNDDAHAEAQRALYSTRREMLSTALSASGFRIDHSQAGLYLWVTHGQDCWQTVADLADLGVVVAPGEFYGDAGMQHVRVALTASTSDIETVCARLSRL